MALNSTICILILCFLSPLVKSELQKFEHATKRDGAVNFLVIGDWGRRGEYNQSQVAKQMGRIGEEMNLDFVVSVGDNFYDNGLKGEDDVAFQESFTDIYTAKSLQTQWYSVLGNHDYRGDAKAQLSPTLRKIDSRWLCLRSFIVDTEIAELFLIDTNPFVDKYFNDPKDHVYDWREIGSRKKYTSNLLKELDSALKESTARWKIVIGHHAVRSVGHHGDTPELVQRLLPILQANNIDFYMNGHDHCLQHISDTESPIQFLTSGAGSKAWRGDFGDTNAGNVKLFYDGQGFMSVQLTPTDAEIAFYNVNGVKMHRFHSSKELHQSY